MVDARETVIKQLGILEKYPPLTTKMGLQVKFMKECISHGSVEKYLATRGLKYNSIREICEERLAKVRAKEYIEPSYFNM